MFIQGEIREVIHGAETGAPVYYVVILSDTRFNEGLTPFVIAAPITARGYGAPLHVAITPPPELGESAYVLIEALGRIEKASLGRAVGVVLPADYRKIEANLDILLHH